MGKRILLFIAILMLMMSCKWVDRTDTNSLQPKLNEELRGRYSENVLDRLGFPDSVRSDTLKGVETFMFHYSDSMVFKYAVGYETLTDQNPPFIDVYMVEGKVFWVKTNLAESVMSHDEWLLSVSKIALYTGALLLIALLSFLVLLLTRVGRLLTIEEKMDKLSDDLNRLDK